MTLKQAIESGKSGMIQTGGEDNYSIDILRETLEETGNVGGTDLNQSGHYFTHEEWAEYEKQVNDDAASEFENEAAGCYN